MDYSRSDELMEEARIALARMFQDNGYVDEFIGSWHRYVDAMEEQARGLNRIATAMEEKND